MARVPPEADRDFTASCLIIDNDRALLLKHRKLDIWLQPGGHIEPGETPDEAAKREALEETGLEVAIHDTFHDKDAPDESHNLPKPFRVNLHKIRDGHWHCDFTFLATAISEHDASTPEEHNGKKWFSRDDLQDDSFDIPDAIRQTVLDALDYSGT